MSEAPTAAGATLVCAVCLYVNDGDAAHAITVINGLAVCKEHADHALDRDGQLWRIIGEIRKERRRDT